MKSLKYVIFSLLAAFAICASSCTTTKAVKWDKCTKSSNWTGKNASIRLMNILSPHMPDSSFNDRVGFIKSRECNCVHLILANKADGEYGGYSIYGNSITWNIDKNYTDIMGKRIKKLRSDGFGIVLWLVTDDDGGWNKTLAGNFKKYVEDIKSLGWFDYASTVVLGIEMNEYWSVSQVQNCVNALRSVYSGKVGIHMTSGKWEWISFGDILFYQVNPGRSAAQIESDARGVVSKCGGKPVNFFELSRSEDRALSEAALRGGCYGVGNW